MDKRTIAPSLGLEAEKRFELKCIHLDLNCFVSIGEYKSDYVVEQNGKTFRVQIKSSDSNEENIPIKCSWGTAKNGWKSYTKKETDYIAVFTRKTCNWYLIPVEEVDELLGFNISSECKYNIYKNNWNLNNNHTTDTQNTFNEAVRLKEKGLSNTYIAARLDKSKSFINRLLREGGAGLKEKLAVATKEKLEQLYLIEKKTMEDISDELNISTWYIRKMFRKYNIQVRTNHNPNGCKSKISTASKEQ